MITPFSRPIFADLIKLVKRIYLSLAITERSSKVSLIAMALCYCVLLLIATLTESIADSAASKTILFQFTLTDDLRFLKMILDESEITTSEVPKNASKGPWWNPCQFCSTNPELFNVLFILILIVLLILTIVVISSCFCLYKMDKRLYFPTRSMGN